MSKGDVIVNLGLPPELMERIRETARREDRPVARVVRELLRLGYAAKDSEMFTKGVSK